MHSATSGFSGCNTRLFNGGVPSVSISPGPECCMGKDFEVVDYLPKSIANVLYPFEWENNFHEGIPYWLVFTSAYWYMGLVATIGYLLYVWLGQRYMSTRKAWDLKPALILWNLFLAVFSTIGFLRTAPHLMISVYEFGPAFTVCRCAAAHYGRGAAGFWVFLFIYSKYVELIDTVFLVMRKRSVIFLHWYHHATVLLYCWDSYYNEQTSGIWFTVMNYGVHSVMYFYYFLAACGKPPKWGQIVTTLQLSQMVVGIAVTVYHWQLYKTVKNCDGSSHNLMAGLAMYGSYFLLFAQFFVKRYFSGAKKDKASTINLKKTD